MKKDDSTPAEVLWPIHWQVGFYQGVRWVWATDADAAQEAVARWCADAMPALVRRLGEVTTMVENQA